MLGIEASTRRVLCEDKIVQKGAATLKRKENIEKVVRRDGKVQLVDALLIVGWPQRSALQCSARASGSKRVRKGFAY